MGDRQEDLRLSVYRQLAGTGRAPSVATLAGQLAMAEEEVRSGLRQLATDRHLVLGAA